MYLTSRAQGRPRALHDHEQLELLLESFTKQVEEIVSEIDTTVANMQSTQEIAELMLDSGRNALLALDVKLSVATVGLGTGALIASTFGMNVSHCTWYTPQVLTILAHQFAGDDAIRFLGCVRLGSLHLDSHRHVRYPNAEARRPCGPHGPDPPLGFPFLSGASRTEQPGLARVHGCRPYHGCSCAERVPTRLWIFRRTGCSRWGGKSAR